jgi:site-specific DNA-methyltransferase (adenine-specific)
MSSLPPSLSPFAQGTSWVQPSANTLLVKAQTFDWLAQAPENSVHAIVTDPPYSLSEYDEKALAKMREGKGGVWRIPPTLNGVQRSALPRFSVLTPKERELLVEYFKEFGRLAQRVLVPGGHLLMASNPLVSTASFFALESVGWEKRGEVIRVVKTLRGGDRPKGAEKEFPDVSVMPKSCWEPWGLFRKPLSEKTVAQNLRRWGTGGLRRISDADPFRDMVEAAPARGIERTIADHPSLKPQRLMRELVRGMLPMGQGVVLDPYAGSGATLAAAQALGFDAVGIERDDIYFDMAAQAIQRLSEVVVK